MSTLEEKIEQLSLKQGQEINDFNELRVLLCTINRDLEIIKEYQKHLQAHLKDSSLSQVKGTKRQ